MHGSDRAGSTAVEQLDITHEVHQTLHTKSRKDSLGYSKSQLRTTTAHGPSRSLACAKARRPRAHHERFDYVVIWHSYLESGRTLPSRVHPYGLRTGHQVLSRMPQLQDADAEHSFLCRHGTDFLRVRNDIKRKEGASSTS